MSIADKLIVCVAPVGSFMGKDSNPHIPLEPREIADEVHRSWNAGASIAHIHARDLGGHATTDPSMFVAIDKAIKENSCDIILQHSTSPGREAGSQVGDGLKPLEPNPEMASVDIGVLVGMRDGEEKLFLWTRSFIQKLLKEIQRRNIKPEIEVYTQGAFIEIEMMIQKGLLQPPYWISFAFDMHRTIQNVVRFNPKTFLHYVDMLPPKSFFSAFGIASSELPVAVQSILFGGHVRVGFEDNVYIRKGELAQSNAQLVERVVRIGRELGREPATPDEARMLLGIPSLGSKT